MRQPKLDDLLTALRDPRRLKRWAGELMLLVAILTAIALWQNRDLPSGSAPPLAGLRNDGVAVDLASATTPTLVVFWATWCPVCRAEAGNIEAVARDWAVLSVAMQSGDAAAITQYLRKEELTTPAVVDEGGDLARSWRVSGVPAHLIVDAAGNIRFRVVGYATEWGLRARLWWAQGFPT